MNANSTSVESMIQTSKRRLKLSYRKDGNLSEDFVAFQERKNLSYFRPEELATLGKGDKIHQRLEDLTTSGKE